MHKVDITAIKFNQAAIVTLTLAAFVIDSPWPALFMAVVMLIGALWPQAALFQQLYRRVLRPAGLLRGHVVDDDPLPHRFAQGLGGSVLAVGSLCLLVLDISWLGWACVLFVTVLAAINLVFSFCLGCFVYYQLMRLGILRRSLPQS